MHNAPTTISVFTLLIPFTNNLHLSEINGRHTHLVRATYLRCNVCTYVSVKPNKKTFNKIDKLQKLKITHV